MKKIKLIPAVLVVGSFVLAGCGETPQPTHTHTYAEAWTTNSTQHWHANTCEAECGQKLASALGNHVDENKDGKCDVCAKELTPAHVHTFSSAWSTDASKHWHAATCEHTDEVSDKAEHSFGEWKEKEAATFAAAVSTIKLEHSGPFTGTEAEALARI